jgi:hypothetical protein
MNKIIKLHWNNYLNSDSGREVVAAFDKLTDPNATMEELLQLAFRFDPEFFRNTSSNERNQELGFLDFFNRFEKNLEEDGYIITDNMSFHGYVEMNEEDIPSKNIRGIVRKIKDYIYFLENNMIYKTIIYQIGDGIAVTERR